MFYFNLCIQIPDKAPSQSLKDEVTRVEEDISEDESDNDESMIRETLTAGDRLEINNEDDDAIMEEDET